VDLVGCRGVVARIPRSRQAEPAAEGIDGVLLDEADRVSLLRLLQRPALLFTHLLLHVRTTSVLIGMSRGELKDLGDDHAVRLPRLCTRAGCAD
jgi:hypothetical protein